MSTEGRAARCGGMTEQAKPPPAPKPPPSGASERMNSADPRTRRHAAEVQQGGVTANPRAKVPSDLYPDPPGVSDTTKGAPDD